MRGNKSVCGGFPRSALYNCTAILKRFAEAYNILLCEHVYRHTRRAKRDGKKKKEPKKWLYCNDIGFSYKIKY